MTDLQIIEAALNKLAVLGRTLRGGQEWFETMGGVVGYLTELRKRAEAHSILHAEPGDK